MRLTVNETLADKILSFRDLGPDWDSYGGRPINEETIKLALSILPILDDGWFVCPAGSGAIVFEKGNAEIEVWYLKSD